MDSAAAFGPSGLLYVVGGQTGGFPTDSHIQAVECFDPRVNRWRLLPESDQDGVQRVDLALVFSIM